VVSCGQLRLRLLFAETGLWSVAVNCGCGCGIASGIASESGLDSAFSSRRSSVSWISLLTKYSVSETIVS